MFKIYKKLVLMSPLNVFKPAFILFAYLNYLNCIWICLTALPPGYSIVTNAKPFGGSSFSYFV